MHLADRGHENVRVQGVALQVDRAGVADRHGCVCLEQQMRNGLAHDVRPPHDDGTRSLGLDPVLGEHPHDPERRGGHEPGTAEIQAARVHRMEPVDVLGRIDRLDRLRLVDVCRERQLYEETVDGVVGVQTGDQLQ